MTAETEYQVFRRDSRGTITFDTASPVKTLQALVKKASEEYEQEYDSYNMAARALETKEKRLDELKARMHKFEVALDAAYKALGPDPE